MTLRKLGPGDYASQANPGGSGMIGYRGRTLAAKLGDVVSVPDFGTGQASFTSAIAAMRAGAATAGIFTTAPAAFLPPGTYTTEAALDVLASVATGLADVRLWAIPGTVTINVAAGTYFLDIADRLSSLYLYGITFVGGKGVVRQKNAGVNVNQMRWVEKCVFYNYTECAIASNASDEPYWRIRDNFFYGSGGATRGVSIGGLNDSTAIEGNSFLNNQYHLVLGPMNSGNMRVVGNDFLSFTGNLCDADIVLVPNDQAGGYGTNAGLTTVFAENKFGNENLKATAPRVLIAALNTASGSGRENHPVSTTWTTDAAGANFLRGIQFRGNRWSLNDGYAAPLIRSYVDQVANVLFADDNVFDGGRPTYLIEWMGAHTHDYSNNWDVRLAQYAESIGTGSPFFTGISNYPIGPVIDAAAITQTRGAVIPWAPSTGSELTLKHCSTSADYTVFSGATKAATTSGGLVVTQVTVAAPGVTALYADIDGTGKTGKAGWFNLQVKLDPTRSITKLRVWLYNYADNISLFDRHITLTADWQFISVPVDIPTTATPAAWQLRLLPDNFTATTADRFLVGGFHLHTGLSPRLAPPSTLVADATDLPTAIALTNALKAAVQRLSGMAVS